MNEPGRQAPEDRLEPGGRPGVRRWADPDRRPADASAPGPDLRDGPVADPAVVRSADGDGGLRPELAAVIPMGAVLAVILVGRRAFDAELGAPAALLVAALVLVVPTLVAGMAWLVRRPRRLTNGVGLLFSLIMGATVAVLVETVGP